MNYNLTVCSKCEKPNVYCKGMCQACYSKMYRNTEKGKHIMKAYNISSGKEAQRKFRERKKANKPPKPPKPQKINCECGKPSIAKNLCSSCYQKNKYVKKEGSRRNTLSGEMIFNKVLIYVKKGDTILNACKKAGFKSSTSLYRLISPIQLATLHAYKIIGFVNDGNDYDDDNFY